MRDTSQHRRSFFLPVFQSLSLPLRVPSGLAVLLAAVALQACIPHYTDFVGAQSDAMADGTLEETDGSRRTDDLRTSDSCTPDCTGKECGTDGCEGTCGSCGPNEYCDGGLCKPGAGQCAPSCDPTLEECVKATTDDWVCASKMVAIPAGNFWMGCNESLDPYCSCPGSDECDYHGVTTGKYWIDTTEVTNAHFVEFLNADPDAKENKCTHQFGVYNCVDTGDGDAQVEENGGLWSVKGARDDYPVIKVTWNGARSYCEWRCPTCRLCSEAEWEKAARGGCENYGNCATESRVWPWGNELPSSCDGTTAVYVGCNCGGGTCEVGTHPGGKSLYQVHDMAGNVWEWVEDWHHESYNSDGGAPTDGSAWVRSGDSYRVRRGGSFGGNGGVLRVSNRDGIKIPTLDGFDFLGFRCCRSE